MNSMDRVTQEKECFGDEESSLSFWTTPSDDDFKFSKLSSSHVSVLAESGPFIAVVLCYWDNVLGPRLQHVWRAAAGDVQSQVCLLPVCQNDDDDDDDDADDIDSLLKSESSSERRANARNASFLNISRL